MGGWRSYGGRPDGARAGRGGDRQDADGRRVWGCGRVEAKDKSCAPSLPHVQGESAFASIQVPFGFPEKCSMPNSAEQLHARWRTWRRADEKSRSSRGLVRQRATFSPEPGCFRVPCPFEPKSGTPDVGWEKVAPEGGRMRGTRSDRRSMTDLTFDDRPRSHATPHPAASQPPSPTRGEGCSVDAALGVSRHTLYQLLDQKTRATPEMAVRLGKLCGDGAEIWLAMQTQRDLWGAKRNIDTSAIPTLSAGHRAARSLSSHRSIRLAHGFVGGGPALIDRAGPIGAHDEA